MNIKINVLHGPLLQKKNNSNSDVGCLKCMICTIDIWSGNMIIEVMANGFYLNY